MTYSKKYKLGGNLDVNRIGFGAMRITNKDNSGMPDNPQNSIDVLKRAVELGVNFIDRLINTECLLPKYLLVTHFTHIIPV